MYVNIYLYLGTIFYTCTCTCTCRDLTPSCRRIQEEPSSSVKETSSLTKKLKPAVAGSKEIKTHVYVWGLNDKDQLGGPKGSKIKTPMLNDTLSAVNCVQIVGGSKSLFCGEHGACCALEYDIVCIGWHV